MVETVCNWWKQSVSFTDYSIITVYKRIKQSVNIIDNVSIHHKCMRYNQKYEVGYPQRRGCFIKRPRYAPGGLITIVLSL